MQHPKHSRIKLKTGLPINGMRSKFGTISKPSNLVLLYQDCKILVLEFQTCLLTEESSIDWSERSLSRESRPLKREKVLIGAQLKPLLSPLLSKMVTT